MEEKAYLDSLKLVSGGQTGVDRAMLDFCMDMGIACGGWCPEGRMAEDGIIDQKYPLKELAGGSYNQRTRANIRDSDASVILYHGKIEGGTLKSLKFAKKEEKPFLLLDMSVLEVSDAVVEIEKFLKRKRPSILNFSGPRQSEWKDAYSCCQTLLKKLFQPA